MFWHCRCRAEFAFAYRAEIELVRSGPPMIVTDWSDASLAVANDDGRVAAERALATAWARTPPQTKERRRLIGHASLATHGSIRSYECAIWLAVL